MGLYGKLMAAVEFKAGGDVFHELFMNRPHHLSNTTPEKVQGCDLHEGEYGKVGSIINWRYIHEGKEKTAKQIIEAIDEEKWRVVFKTIDGDMTKLYKDMIITTSIEKKGDDIDLATWTMEYETLTDDIDHPKIWKNPKSSIRCMHGFFIKIISMFKS